MKVFRKLLVAIIVVALLTFTAAFLINSYNSGKIGNKAEKVADDFETEIVGTWNGSYSISGLTFSEDKSAVLTMLGISLDGTYVDEYNLETEVHTLTLKYESSLGVSVTRKYTASLDGNTLKLTDIEIPSVVLNYTKSGTESDSTDKTTAPTDKNNNTTVYNPGIDVFRAALLGDWESSVDKNSGYSFIDSSKVTVKILGITYDGTYSVAVDEETGKYIVKIDYMKISEFKISNSYYASIDGDNMTFLQKGAESIKATFVKSK